jgi:ABC-2 type transport system ATP-binding protein
MDILQTCELTKHYQYGVFKRKNIIALEKVSLSIKQGEIFGLLGPNGAGKTTFVKLILSITLPTSGSAKILNYSLGERALREQCGYLPENHRYPGFLTALDTLIFFGRLNGLSGSELKNKSISLLELVGLKDWVKVKTKKFSKGMLQRLGLAQALINDPKLLFLDEPTDGVDPIGRKEIRDILVDLKSRGTSIFLNSHLLSEVEMICDRVAILNKGKIVQTGTIAELTSQKLVYEIQVSSVFPDTLRMKLQATNFSFEIQGTKLIATCKEKSELNSLIDLIRAEGIGIEGMVQQKTSLEDYFIQLVKGTSVL